MSASAGSFFVVVVYNGAVSLSHRLLSLTHDLTHEPQMSSFPDFKPKTAK